MLCPEGACDVKNRYPESIPGQVQMRNGGKALLRFNGPLRGGLSRDKINIEQLIGRPASAYILFPIAPSLSTRLNSNNYPFFTILLLLIS